MWLERTELLVGKEKIDKLKSAHVLVIGLGGVGAYAAELICRSGVGNMTIIDNDTVSQSNINRQLPALHSTVGHEKTDVLAARFKDINPNLELTVLNEYITEESIPLILSSGKYNYIVDAIDTLTPKVNLIRHACELNIPIVSSMGAGGKYSPSMVQVTDISKSYNCTLARAVRKRLHRLGIYKGFKVVFSPEDVNSESVIVTEGETNKRSNVGTISYMPPIFGCYCASVVVQDLL